MATFITTDETGTIIAHADWPFADSEKVDFDVVRGWDGRLYKSGEEPSEPESVPAPTPPVTITSDNITMLDADALCQAMGAGEKTAAWLIAKLEL